MKIAKIRARHLFGIKEYEASGNDCEILGKTGAGKTAIIDTIRYGIENEVGRELIVSQGTEEGEIFIEFDTGISLFRKNRPTKKTDYISVKDNGITVGNPATFLKSLFTPLQLDPMKFLQMKSQEQDRVILDLVEYAWDLNWIKQKFGEIVPEVDYEQHLLRVLYDIEKEDGYYFQKRQDINRDIRNNKAIISDIKESLPENYKAEDWKDKNLAALYTQIEQIRSKNRQIELAKNYVNSFEGKKRALQADREIKKSVINDEVNQKRNALEQRVIALSGQIKLCEKELSLLEEKKIDKVKIIEQEYENNLAEHVVRSSESLAISEKTVQPVDDLLLEAGNVEKMKGYISEYNRLRDTELENEKFIIKSNVLTDKIELARNLPGQILEECEIPFTGFTIEDGKPRFNGLPISNLSDGEKLMLCIDIAKEKKNNLQLILIDGIEKLSSDMREKTYQKCRAAGVQFIATRTTDDPDLLVMEL